MHTKMDLKVKTEEDYRNALQRFLEISGAPQNKEEMEEMFKLMEKMEEYEQRNCPDN